MLWTKESDGWTNVASNQLTEQYPIWASQKIGRHFLSTQILIGYLWAVGREWKLLLATLIGHVGIMTSSIDMQTPDTGDVSAGLQV